MAIVVDRTKYPFIDPVEHAMIEAELSGQRPRRQSSAPQAPVQAPAPTATSPRRTEPPAETYPTPNWVVEDLRSIEDDILRHVESELGRSPRAEPAVDRPPVAEPDESERVQSAGGSQPRRGMPVGTPADVLSNSGRFTAADAADWAMGKPYMPGPEAWAPRRPPLLRAVEDPENDDVPSFIRGPVDDVREISKDAPVQRPERPAWTRALAPRPTEPGATDSSWVPPAQVRPSAPSVGPRAPSHAAPRTGGGIGGLLLTYAVILLIPAMEWSLGRLDVRLAAGAPAAFFVAWLLIHFIRRDQVVHLRIITVWQILHACVAFWMIGPWGGPADPVRWTAAAIAAAGAVIVAAASAGVEVADARSAAARSPLPTPARPAARSGASLRTTTSSRTGQTPP